MTDELSEIVAKLYKTATLREENVARVARNSLRKICASNPKECMSFLSNVQNSNPNPSEKELATWMSLFSSCFNEMNQSSSLQTFLNLQKLASNQNTDIVLREWDNLCENYISDNAKADIIDQLQFSSEAEIITLSKCAKFHAESLEKYLSTHRNIMNTFQFDVIVHLFSEISKHIEYETVLIIEFFYTIVNQLIMTRKKNYLICSKNLIHLISKNSCILNSHEILQRLIENLSMLYKNTPEFYDILIDLSYEHNIRLIVSYLFNEFESGTTFKQNEVKYDNQINQVISAFNRLIKLHTQIIIQEIINSLSCGKRFCNILLLEQLILTNNDEKDIIIEHIVEYIPKITANPLIYLRLCTTIIKTVAISNNFATKMLSFMINVILNQNEKDNYIDDLISTPNKQNILDFCCDAIFEFTSLIPHLSHLICEISDSSEELSIKKLNSEEMNHPFVSALIRRSIQEKSLLLLYIFSFLLSMNKFQKPIFRVLHLLVIYTFPLATTEDIFTESEDNNYLSLIDKIITAINDRHFQISLSSVAISEIGNKSIKDHHKNCIEVLCLLSQHFPPETSANFVTRLLETLEHNDSSAELVSKILSQNPQTVITFLKTVNIDTFTVAIVQHCCAHSYPLEGESVARASLKLLQKAVVQKNVNASGILMAVTEACRLAKSSNFSITHSFNFFFEYAVGCFNKTNYKVFMQMVLVCLKSLVIVAAEVQRVNVQMLIENVFRSQQLIINLTQIEIFGETQNLLIAIQKRLPSAETFVQLLWCFIPARSKEMHNIASFLSLLYSSAITKETKIPKLPQVICCILACSHNLMQQSLDAALAVFKCVKEIPGRPPRVCDFLKQTGDDFLMHCFEFCRDMSLKGHQQFTELLANIISVMTKLPPLDSVTADSMSKRFPWSEKLLSVLSERNTRGFILQLLKNTQIVNDLAQIEKVVHSTASVIAEMLFKNSEDKLILIASNIVKVHATDDERMSIACALLLIHYSSKSEELKKVAFSVCSKEILSSKSKNALSYIMSNADIGQPKTAFGVAHFCAHFINSENADLFFPTYLGFTHFDGSKFTVVKFLPEILKLTLTPRLAALALSHVKDLVNERDERIFQKLQESISAISKSSNEVKEDCFVELVLDMASFGIYSEGIPSEVIAKFPENMLLKCIDAVLKKEKIDFYDDFVERVCEKLFVGNVHCIPALLAIQDKPKIISKLKNYVSDLVSSNNDEVSILAMQEISVIYS